MANVKIGIDASGNFDKQVKSAKELNKELDGSVKKVKSLDNAMKQTGGVGGDREAYRNARAGAGTGAAGRDFAKQAQGLGGLVHVYATFAANIFAVTAAYQALSKAFEYERLEKSAELMSGKLGISINNLGKDLQKTTGYAISMGEALQFSAMGISAGITEKQLKSLVTIAKGAANALGRDVNDATRRIIQGTAKQEQEILDELGIFVKAKKAYEEYAKARNMRVEDLSATQRVQAYADAVERAGNKWKEFAEIDDPFAKFTATAKQAGLELLGTINAFIAPILNFLSKSEGLVKVILLTITAQLVKMAIPHLGDQIRDAFQIDQAKVLKYNEGLRLVVDKRKIELEALKVQENALAQDIRTKYASMNKGGANFGNMLATGILAAPDASLHVGAEDRKAIAKRITATIIQAALVSENALEEAKAAKLIRQDSTIKNIKVNKQTLNALTKEAIMLATEENALLVKYSTIQDTVLFKAAELEAVEISHEKRSQSRNVRNATRAAEAASAAYGHLGAQDIPFFGAEGKLKLMMGEFGTSIITAEGKFGKFINTIKAGSAIAGMALTSLMSIVGYAVLAFAAWEIVIKPLLYYFKIFSEEADKVDESTIRLTDSAKALSQGWVNAAEGMDTYGISIKELDSYYTKISVSALSARDAILEQQAALKALKALKPGTKPGEEDLTALQSSITAALNKDIIPKNSQRYQDLLSANVLLQNAKITGVRVEERYTEAVRLSTLALNEQNTVTEKASKELSIYNNLLETSEKAIEDLNKRHKDTLDKNIPQLINTETVTSYKAIRDAIESINKLKDTNAVSAASSNTLDTFTNITKTLPDATNRVLKFATAMSYYNAAVYAKNPVDTEKYAKALRELSMSAHMALDKQTPPTGAGKGIKKLPVDYAILESKAKTYELTREFALTPSMENIERRQTQALILAGLEAEKRYGEILKANATEIDKKYERIAVGQAHISAVNAAIDTASKETIDFTIKLAEERVAGAKVLVDEEASYSNYVSQTNKLLEAQVALLALGKLSIHEQAKATEDLNEKNRLAQLKKAGHLTIGEIAKGGFYELGAEIPGLEGTGYGGETSARRVSRTEMVGKTAMALMEEDIRKAKIEAKGPIEGTVTALTEGIGSSMSTLMDTIQSGATVTASAISDAFRNAASDIFKQMAIEQAKLAVKSGIMSIGSMLGFGGPIKSANGNVMTEYGAMKLNTYASGGVATSPQLSVFGEGRTPEAYVPLPDGRSIPVTVKGGGNGNNINIQVNVNTTTGTTNTQASGGGSNMSAMADLGNLISNKVKEVLIQEKRPNGLLAS